MSLVAVAIALVGAEVKGRCLRLKVMDHHTEEGFKGKATCYCRAGSFLLRLSPRFQTVDGVDDGT